ncbi:MAG: glycosyltransferase family 4 protein [Caldilineaceae bacterium]|nr:glycosyltransferase family 4 protein [Caldilineaceae bacterium]
MNILIMARDYKPLTGGIAEYTHRLTLELHRSGDRVRVLSQTRPDAEEFDAAVPFPVVRANFSRYGEWGPIALIPRENALMRAYLQSPPDVVICNSLGREAQACRRFCRFHFIPFVLFTYGREITRLQHFIQAHERPRYTHVMGYILRHADAVVTISRYTRDCLLELHVDPGRIALVPPGIDPDDRTPPAGLTRFALPADPAAPVLLTVARLVERKGVDTVLAALPDIVRHAPDLVYVIAGEGPAAEELAAQAQVLGIERHVLFTGRVSEGEKSALLDRANIFIMPNRRLADGDVEGFGIVFLEAGLHGKPVIGGASGGAVDAIDHGVTGLLVQPDAPDALRDAVITLLDAPDLAARMGAAGARRAREEFAWNRSGALLRARLLQLTGTEGE